MSDVKVAIRLRGEACNVFAASFGKMLLERFLAVLSIVLVLRHALTHGLRLDILLLIGLRDEMYGIVHDPDFVSVAGGLQLRANEQARQFGPGKAWIHPNNGALEASRDAYKDQFGR